MIKDIINVHKIFFFEKDAVIYIKILFDADFIHTFVKANWLSFNEC